MSLRYEGGDSSTAGNARRRPAKARTSPHNIRNAPPLEECARQSLEAAMCLNICEVRGRSSYMTKRAVFFALNERQKAARPTPTFRPIRRQFGGGGRCARRNPSHHKHRRPPRVFFAYAGARMKRECRKAKQSGKWIGWFSKRWRLQDQSV